MFALWLLKQKNQGNSGIVGFGDGAWGCVVCISVLSFIEQKLPYILL
jgi:hypothetical protein